MLTFWTLCNHHWYMAFQVIGITITRCALVVSNMHLTKSEAIEILADDAVRVSDYMEGLA